MGKALSELSQEELWQLFPIILKEYNPAYAHWYRDERERILESLGECTPYRISHIGSTAVPGLLSKPTVDILLETVGEPSEITAGLKSAGWLLMASESEPLRLVFNKGYTPEGFAEKVYHLHVRRPGDWDELYFRDYLLAHPDTAQEYGRLKGSLQARFEHDRDGYTQAKTAFVRKYTSLSRLELGNRYVPAEAKETHEV